jgi:hypothetical protein
MLQRKDVQRGWHAVFTAGRLTRPGVLRSKLPGSPWPGGAEGYWPGICT